MTAADVILIDAHVHGHACFALGDVLESGRRNFAHARSRCAAAGPRCDALLLAEGSREDFFVRCRARAGGGPLEEAPRWRIEPTGEDVSLRALHDDGAALLIVAGRQIATSDRLELINVASADAVDDGMPLTSCFEAVDAPGSLVILPWGFGKWTSRRGRIIDSILARGARAGALFVGDNGGRADLLRRPRRIATAEERRVAGVPGGAFDLPGSDPLPFPAQVRRVGSRGVVLRGTLDGPRPARRLLSILAELDAPPEQFGAGRPLPAFVLDQVRMQWRRRPGGGRR